MNWNKNPILTIDEMYQADEISIRGGVSGKLLMKRAGEAVAKAVISDMKSTANKGNILFLCGPGNNGGDGFVAAQILHDQGYDVKLYSLCPINDLKGDARFYADRWSRSVCHKLSRADVERASLIVDALFGAGLSRPLDPEITNLVKWCEGRRLLAVDVPSGISGDTGEVLGDVAFEADKTVTFFLKKPGHLLFPGRDYSGEVLVEDIGIKSVCLTKISPKIAENHPLLWQAKIPAYKPDKHKYHFGHSFVWGGTMSGAARLAAMAALRIGSGLVSVVCPERDRLIYSLTSPSLIVNTYEELEDLPSSLRLKKVNASLVGPGAGRERALIPVVMELLADGSFSVVLDADALSVFSDDPQELFSHLRSDVVLTPHEGEFKTLFPELTGSRIERAQKGSEKAGCIVVLKGADTIVAAPDGRVVINSNAPFWLARGGTGDILAGIITGLLAQGMEGFDAACAGVWLHGEAANCVEQGMIAEDLLLKIGNLVDEFR